MPRYEIVAVFYKDTILYDIRSIATGDTIVTMTKREMAEAFVDAEERQWKNQTR